MKRTPRNKENVGVRSVPQWEELDTQRTPYHETRTPEPQKRPIDKALDLCRDISNICFGMLPDAEAVKINRKALEAIVELKSVKTELMGRVR